MTCHAEQARCFDIMQFGAKGDGATLNTQAIQQAFDACAQAGGGQVCIPAGIYLTGALRLFSNTTLFLDHGAVLQGSPRLDDYRFKGELVGLIIARDAENISIGGPGVIDGNGDAFIDVEDSLRFYNLAQNPGQDIAPLVKDWPRHVADGPVRMKSRPGNLVVFSNCRNVRMEDVVVRNAPFWTLHFDGCNELRVLDVTVRNNPLIPNNDGIHCTTSRHVQIRGCDIIAGDDPIAITGIDDHQTIIPGFLGHQKTTEHVIVANCFLSGRSCGVRIGYGANDIRDCRLENLTIHDSLRGIGIFARDAGSIEDVSCDNIRIRTRLFAGGLWWGNGEPIHVSSIRQRKDVPVGRIRNIRFTNIDAEGEGGSLIRGSEESVIEDVHLENVRLRQFVGPLRAKRGGRLDLRPTFSPETDTPAMPIPAILLSGVENASLRNVDVQWPAQPIPEVAGGIVWDPTAHVRMENVNGQACQN